MIRSVSVCVNYVTEEIFQFCIYLFLDCVFTSGCKKANIAPICKRGGKALFKNYLPFSFSLIYIKILE